MCKQTTQIKDFRTWLESFHRELSSTLSLNKSEILELVGVQKVSDFAYLEENFTKELTKIETKVMHDISSSTSVFSDVTSWQNSPHIKLYDNLRMWLL